MGISATRADCECCLHRQKECRPI